LGLFFFVRIAILAVRANDWRRRGAVLFGGVAVFGMCVAATKAGRWAYRENISRDFPEYDAIADAIEAKVRASGLKHQTFFRPRQGLKVGVVSRDANDRLSVYFVLDMGSRNIIYRSAPGELAPIALPGECMAKFSDRWYSNRCAAW
jgi:hypothetical protein